MNTNKKTLSIVERAKKSFLGRIVCRVMGEESGQAMMEYVIIAVLIAAAVAVGAWFFGKDIMNMFGVGGAAVTANDTRADQMQDAAQKGSKDGHSAATTADKKKIITKDESKGDVNL